MKRYRVELTEEQLRLIADCVEDCHRFAAGQTRLSNTTGHLPIDECKRVQEHTCNIDLPLLSWDGGFCEDETKRRFVAQTYGIYREILHFFNKGNQDSVYSNETLTCEENVPLIKIKKI